MLAVWLLIAAVVQAPAPAVEAPPPTAAAVSAKLEPSGGSCVMYSSGVCVCSQYEPTVDQLACNRSDETGQYVCSYNVIWEDAMGRDPRYVEQRMDRFQRAADDWTKSEHGKPVILDDQSQR